MKNIHEVSANYLCGKSLFLKTKVAGRRDVCSPARCELVGDSYRFYHPDLYKKTLALAEKDLVFKRPPFMPKNIECYCANDGVAELEVEVMK